MTDPVATASDAQTKDYLDAVRRAVDWLEKLDLPPAALAPPRHVRISMSMSWNLSHLRDDYTPAMAIVRTLTPHVVGWRKLDISHRHVTLAAVEQTIPATIYVTLNSHVDAGSFALRTFDEVTFL